MLQGEPLPLAANFRGTPPLPRNYKHIADGVAEAEFTDAETSDPAVAQWMQSLGRIRRARFFALPGDEIRYEIASEGAYRVGFWKQVWRDGKLESWRPLSETRVTAAAPLFDDITGHAFAGVDSFHEQMLQGNGWWRARLDAATGITVDGTNGVAVGDIDNDGWDEIYVCQTGGLPNRLYKNRGDATFEDITGKAGVGVLDNTACALFADFRNSGHQDLVVLRDTGPLYFANRGDGVFTHIPDVFQFRTAPQGAFTGMAAADYDRDGRLDLYLCTYVYFQTEDQYALSRAVLRRAQRATQLPVSQQTLRGGRILRGCDRRERHRPQQRPVQFCPGLVRFRGRWLAGSLCGERFRPEQSLPESQRRVSRRSGRRGRGERRARA